jgi:hypothetical protein
MPTINVVNGHASAPLTPNENFTWLNPTSNQVTLTNCGGFCTQATYTVPAKSATAPGEASGQINANPNNWSFTENPSSTWNPGGVNPGLPRVQNPTMARDVA